VTATALDAFFAPRSVAVVGASASRGKAGYLLLKNILDGNYRGRIYPVNPNARRILGRRSYASVAAVPGELDLAILVVANPQVVPVLHECAQKRVRAVAIVTAGFAEIGDQGRAAQREVADIVRRGGMRAIGPNSVGLASAPGKLIASFVPFRKWPEGAAAIAAQTGIFTGAYVDQVAASQTQRVGFSRSICLGNTVDVDEADFVEYAAQDSATRVIALHLESFKRPRVFLAAANRAKALKPVIVLKTGRTEAGARAAASHSGALAAQDRVVHAALKQYGIVRTETLEEFAGVMKAFAWQPVPRGNRVAIVTLSGALGVMAVDEMQGTGLELARFAPATIRAIARLMPGWQPVQNPADVWMALGSGPREAHEQILGAMLADPGVDMLLGILLPIPNADFAGVRQVFARLTRAHPDKPLFLILVGGQVKQRWLRELEPLHLPVFPDPRLAVRAMEAMRFYATHRDRICPDPNLDAAQAMGIATTTRTTKTTKTTKGRETVATRRAGLQAAG
jgi:acyl-CoA synthetase (NDP forming)